MVSSSSGLSFLTCETCGTWVRDDPTVLHDHQRWCVAR